MRMSSVAPAAEPRRESAPDIEQTDNRPQAATDGIASVPRQADRLAALTGAADLFRTPDGIAYADLEIDGHRETWAVRSRFFRRWATWQLLSATNGVASTHALNEALGLLEARALSGGPVHEVKVRLCRLGDTIYLDLGDPAWRAVEIDA